jgi:transcriptional regulator of acetoin/glycerol metabolism
MANETITFDLDADHDWTANKRRLEKAMLERAVELHGNNYAATGRYLGITKVAVHHAMRRHGLYLSGPERGMNSGRHDQGPAVDREQLIEALRKCDGSTGGASALLGVSRHTIWKMCRRYGVDSRQMRKGAHARRLEELIEKHMRAGEALKKQVTGC